MNFSAVGLDNTAHAHVAVQNQVEASDGGGAGTTGRGGQLRRRTAHAADESVLGDVRPAHGQPHRQPRRHPTATPGLSGGGGRVYGRHGAGRRLQSRITGVRASSARPCRRRAHADAPPAAAAAASHGGSERPRTGLLPGLQRDRHWT